MKRIAGIVLCSMTLAAGIFLVALGIGKNHQRKEQQEVYAETTGVVKDYEARKSSRRMHRASQTTYACIVEYEVNGVTYQVSEEVSQGVVTSDIGDERTVHYDPENPEKSYLEEPIASYTFLIFFGVVFFIVIPLVLLLNMTLPKGILMKISELIIMILVGTVGFAILYYCKTVFGTLNPLVGMYDYPGSGIAFVVGYIFCLFGVVIIPSSIIYRYFWYYDADDTREQTEEIRLQSNLKDSPDGTRVIAEKMIQVTDEEREIQFRNRRREDVYYYYPTTVKGYFVEGRAYIICMDNLERRVPVAFRDGKEIYNLESLQLSIDDFAPDIET